jgi:hypothetical protein
VSININQHLPLQRLPKFTQIWIFGLKTNHLATLRSTRLREQKNIPFLTKLTVHDAL